MQIEVIKHDLEKYLNEESELVDDRIVILDDETIEYKEFWIFFYTNKKFLETNDFSDMIVGNSSIIINKLTGEKYVTGTAYPLEYYIRQYENK